MLRLGAAHLDIYFVNDSVNLERSRGRSHLKQEAAQSVISEEWHSEDKQCGGTPNNYYLRTLVMSPPLKGLVMPSEVSAFFSSTLYSTSKRGSCTWTLHPRHSSLPRPDRLSRTCKQQVSKFCLPYKEIVLGPRPSQPAASKASHLVTAGSQRLVVGHALPAITHDQAPLAARRRVSTPIAHRHRSHGCTPGNRY